MKKMAAAAENVAKMKKANEMAKNNHNRRR